MWIAFTYTTGYGSVLRSIIACYTVCSSGNTIIAFGVTYFANISPSIFVVMANTFAGRGIQTSFLCIITISASGIRGDA